MKDRNIKSLLNDYVEFANDSKNEYIKNILLSLIANYEQNLLQDTRPQKIWASIFKAFFSKYNVNYIEPNTHKAQILIWPVQLNHLDYLIPVYHALPIEAQPTFICYRKDILKILKASNLPTIEVKINHNFNFSINGFKRSILLYTIILRALFTKRFINKNIPNLIATLQQFSYYEIYSQLFHKLKYNLNPKYHLLGYEHSVVCKPINILSNQFGVLTGNIQHGALNENLIPYSICKHQFVWDDFAKSQYKNNDQKIFATGSPNINLQETKTDIPADFNEMFKYDSVALVCYSGPGHNVTLNGHLKNLDALLIVIKKLKDIQFVVKLHNKDKTYYYNQLLKENNVTIIDQKSKFFSIPIVNYIQHSKLIITGASTVSIEAAQQGKPVICMDLNQELSHIEFIRSDMFYHCETSIEFERSLLSIIEMDNKFQLKQEALLHFKNSCERLKNEFPPQKISNIIIQSIKPCVE